jgi:hypothetical protein
MGDGVGSGIGEGLISRIGEDIRLSVRGGNRLPIVGYAKDARDTNRQLEIDRL